MAKSNTKLSDLLPEIATKRLTLKLYEPQDDEESQCLLDSLNNETAHAQLGDLGLRNYEGMKDFFWGSPLRASWIKPAQKPLADSSDIEIDVVVYYIVYYAEEPVGGISLSQRNEDIPPDIGWCMLERVMNKGIATEAAAAALKVFRENLGVKEVICWPISGNLSSVRVSNPVDRAPLSET